LGKIGVTIYFMDISLNRFKLLPKATKRLNRKIEDQGLVEAMRRLMSKTRTKIEIQGKTKNIEEILKNESVLILANHPNESDLVVLLSSIEPRADIYFIGNVLLKGILSQMDRHILPVYLPNVRHKKFNLFKMKILKRIHKIPVLNDEDRHIKNVEAIETASKIVQKGGAVAIFPGAGGKNDDWFTGVGYLIKGITNLKTKIVMINIRNTTDLDYLRLIPGVSRFLKTIKINFFEPIDLNKYSHKEPKVIAKELHDIYYKKVNIIRNEEHQED
jgi:1-acyl-sn-glycerol-3-phosphate acyltransferase